MIVNERDNRHEAALSVATHLLRAARTAPKGKGVDLIECAVVEGEDLETLAAEMERIGTERGHMFFLRDANCIRASECVVLIGTRHKVQGLNCARCGFPTCAEKPRQVPCAINVVDVGIAVGSAVSLAADLRIDTRIMYSAGVAADHLALLGEDTSQIYALPLSISSKSPFFDRK
jgi:uncharacterized ferredoxin-like protein